MQGTWRIAPMAAASKTVTLVPNASETISLAVGDSWQGVYLFDSKTVRNGATLTSVDAINPASIGGSPVSEAVATTPAAADPSEGHAVVPVAPAAAPQPAPALASLELSRTTAGSGESFSAVVTLTAPAPAGDVVVALSSSCAALEVPSVVVIPAGLTSMAFTVTTACACPPHDQATITAVYGAVHVATVTVTDCPPVTNEKRPGRP